MLLWVFMLIYAAPAGLGVFFGERGGFLLGLGVVALWWSVLLLGLVLYLIAIGEYEPRPRRD